MQSGQRLSPINPRNFWFWFGGIWLGVGLPFLLIGAYFAWDEFTLDQRLERSGQRVQGMVLVKKWDGGSDGKHPSFHVRYRFNSAAGRAMVSEAEISEPAWVALREREPVGVTYLPDSPRTNRVDGRVVKWLMGAIFCAAGALLTLLGGFVMLKAIAAARLLRRLREEGNSTEAKVIEVAPTGYMLNRVRQWRVLYRYRDYAGIEHDGRSPAMPKETAERWHPGDRVKVYFDPLKPGRSAWTSEP